MRNILIPLVHSISLLSSKFVNFKAFKEAMDIYIKKEHLTDEGLIRLVQIAYSSTTKGKRRRYTLEGYLKKIIYLIIKKFNPYLKNRGVKLK